MIYYILYKYIHITNIEGEDHDIKRTKEGSCGICGAMEGSGLRKGTEPAVLDGLAGQRFRCAGLYSCVIDSFILF